MPCRGHSSLLWLAHYIKCHVLTQLLYNNTTARQCNFVSQGCVCSDFIIQVNFGSNLVFFITLAYLRLGFISCIVKNRIHK